MGDYRQLRVWAQAHQVALQVYRITEGFPRSERYGIVAQLRSAAVSVPSNLAEGSGRGSLMEMARYASVSLGSASELEYQLLLSRDLGYLDAGTHDRLAEEVDHVRRMLGSLAKTLRRQGASQKA